MRLGSDADKALTEVISKTQQVRPSCRRTRKIRLSPKAPALVRLDVSGVRLLAHEVGADHRISQPRIQPRMATIEALPTHRFSARAISRCASGSTRRMASHNITAKDISDASATIIFWPRRVRPRVSSSRLPSIPHHPEDTGSLCALPIRGVGDTIVRLGDVAHVELALTTIRSKSRSTDAKASSSASPDAGSQSANDRRGDPRHAAQPEDELPEGMDVIMSSIRPSSFRLRSTRCSRRSARRW